jgi:hypothetical protein
MRKAVERYFKNKRKIVKKKKEPDKIVEIINLTQINSGP